MSKVLLYNCYRFFSVFDLKNYVFEVILFILIPFNKKLLSQFSNNLINCRNFSSTDFEIYIRTFNKIARRAYTKDYFLYFLVYLIYQIFLNKKEEKNIRNSLNSL